MPIRKNVFAIALIATTAALPLATFAAAPNVTLERVSATRTGTFPVHDSHAPVPQDHVRVSFRNQQERPHYIRIEGVEVRIEANSTRTFDIPRGTPVYISRDTRHHAAGDVLLNVSDTDSNATITLD